LPCSWNTVSNLIKAGSILIDKKYKFNDGSVKTKLLLILSNKIIGNSYIFCLTTSQKRIYPGSYADFYVTNDPAFDRETIIEIERIDLLPIECVKEKYNNGELVIKRRNKLAPEELSKILDKIQDAKRIPAYKKMWLDL